MLTTIAVSRLSAWNSAPISGLMRFVDDRVDDRGERGADDDGDREVDDVARE